MATVVAVFAGFMNIFARMEEILSSLSKVGFSVPEALAARIELMRKVRKDLGEPDEQGHFRNPSRDRIADASREVGSILSIVEVHEKEFYRRQVASLKEGCEALFEQDSHLNERVRELKQALWVSGKYKIDQIPLPAMRKRFARHLEEFRALQMERADMVTRRVMAEITNPPAKAARKSGRSPAKREADRQRREAMKGKSNGGGKSRKKAA